MIFALVHRHLGASGVISPWLGVLHPICTRPLTCGPPNPAKDVKVCHGHHRKAKGHQDPYARVSFGAAISVGLRPAPLT
jgi:hypothetical protein